MAGIVRGVMQHGRIGKTGAEDEERAEQQGGDAGGKTIGEGKGFGLNVSGHDNLRAGCGETSPGDWARLPSDGRSPGSRVQALSRQRISLAFPRVQALRKADDS